MVGLISICNHSVGFGSNDILANGHCISLKTKPCTEYRISIMKSPKIIYTHM
jgi:hypothetical protein